MSQETLQPKVPRDLEVEFWPRILPTAPVTLTSGWGRPMACRWQVAGGWGLVAGDMGNMIGKRVHVTGDRGHEIGDMGDGTGDR